MESLEVQTQNFALITLKERCHFLKQQLKTVDEENIKLKVQIAQNNLPKSCANPNTNALIAEVEALKKEKEQLTNQIHILATENNNVWARLSRLTVVNRNLTRRFTKIADTLEKHGIQNSLCESEIECEPLSGKDYRKSIEEMSLRLINSIKLEKTELERQYNQMVDLHKNEGVLPAQDFAFSSLETDEDGIMAGVKKHSQKLTQLKQALLKQKAALAVAIQELRKSKEAKAEVKGVCTREASTVTEAALDDLNASIVHSVTITPTIESNPAVRSAVVNDHICPMCGKDDFSDASKLLDHVETHFDSELNEEALNSFVEVTHQ